MDIVTRLNWVDVLVIIIMLRMSYVAFQDGLSHEIFPLLGAIGVITLSLYYYNKLALYISQNLGNVPIAILNFLSFIILVFAAAFVFKLIRVVLDKIIKVSWHPLIERFGGLIAGVAKASIVTSTILIILALIPLPYLQRSIRDRSVTGMYFLKIGPSIYEKVSRFLPTIKIEGAPVNREELVNILSSDKSIMTEKAQGKEKKPREREKAAQF